MTLDDVDALVFDFDSVLTNNLVNLNQEGIKIVIFSRADGAFDALRKLNKPEYIINREKFCHGNACKKIKDSINTRSV